MPLNHEAIAAEVVQKCQAMQPQIEPGKMGAIGLNPLVLLPLVKGTEDFLVGMLGDQFLAFVKANPAVLQTFISDRLAALGVGVLQIIQTHPAPAAQ